MSTMLRVRTAGCAHVGSVWQELLQSVRLNLRVRGRNGSTGHMKIRKGHPGIDPTLWANGFYPVFEDDHFESQGRKRG